MGSDHNLLWDKVRFGSMELIMKRIRLKWRFIGREDWEEHQQKVEEVFVGSEKDFRKHDEERDQIW